MQKHIRTLSLLLAFALLSLSANALTLTGVQSRKLHGATPLDVPVDFAKNISGAVTVESRAMGTAIGAGHEIVFQFDTMISASGSASVTDESGVAVAFNAPVLSGNDVSVTITALADAKRVTVRLIGVNGTAGADFAAAVGFLIGDANDSGNVNAADTSQVKSRAGQLVNVANAKFDFNTTGVVTAADIAAVKARQPRALLPAYTLSGTVSGLSGAMVLQNNGGSNFTVSANGNFTFPSGFTGAYNVTVLQQPAGQICTVANSTGTITILSVTNISVTCVSAMPATIYEIKGGTVAPGTLVQLNNQLVTGIKAGSGFFLQVKLGDSGYTTPPFSGIFVFTRAALPFAVGNRVSVTGTVQESNGETQLAAAVITIDSVSVELPPVPVLVASAADIATGGPSAGSLEGVIVRVSNVQVAAQDVPQGEFTVTGGLVVDDFLFPLNPMPDVGQVISSLTGTLATITNTSKLLPRSAGDLVLPTPTFGPASTYIREGDAGVSTFPAALTISLGAPAFGFTFVPISSSNPASLSVQGGGVTIPSGQSSAPVILTAYAQSASVTLTATLGAQILTSNVRVIGAAEQATLASLTPPATTVLIGGSTTLEVTLDIPAPIGGTVVTLALSPANAGTIPTTVFVPANAVSASFGYSDASMVGSAQITATLFGTSIVANLTMSNSAQFVINEVDYDQAGTDTAEFIELYNGTGSSIDLTNYAIVLVNGASNIEYVRISLAAGGTLAAGQYLVAGHLTVLANLPQGVIAIPFPNVTDYIQNGPPDGIALINTATLSVVDSLSYEGAITAATITGFPASVNLVRGTALLVGTADSNTAIASLCRFPNGARTNDDATDWRVCNILTPGSTNLQN